MRNGSPDAARFAETIGTVIDRAKSAADVSIATAEVLQHKFACWQKTGRSTWKLKIRAKEYLPASWNPPATPLVRSEWAYAE